MAIASAPSVISNQSFQVWAGKGPSAPDQRAAKNVIRVGTAVVLPGDNAVVPLGGNFDVWYDKSAHALLIDITSAQIGGPV